VPVIVGTIKAPEDQPGFAKILALINDDRTIEEIAIQTHSREDFVSRVLYDLVRSGQIKMVRPRSVAGESAPASLEGGEIGSEALLREARKHLTERRFDHALRHARAAKNLDPNTPSTQLAVTEVETQIKQAIEDAGVVLSAIPKLNRTPEEISSLSITPKEGFILSRINEQYDIETILKISPMPTLDAQVVFWTLAESGHIRLETLQQRPF